MENIVLLDKDNVQSNINIIKKILNNNKLRSKIGLSAQKTVVKNFTTQAMANCLMDAISKIKNIED